MALLPPLPPLTIFHSHFVSLNYRNIKPQTDLKVKFYDIKYKKRSGLYNLSRNPKFWQWSKYFFNISFPRKLSKFKLIEDEGWLFAYKSLEQPPPPPGRQTEIIDTIYEEGPPAFFFYNAPSLLSSSS